MLEFELEETEPFAADGLLVALIKLPAEALADVQVKVGEREYHYDRSYPIKGYSAVMPGYLREQLAAGREPLIIERPDRYYLYFATP